VCGRGTPESMTSATHLRGEWELPAMPRSVRAARHGVRELVALGGTNEELIDVAELLTSELVTNAVRHTASGQVGVRVLVDAGHVTVEVRDEQVCGLPEHPVQPRDADEGGRGLLLVDRLADRWGVAPGDGHKTVWFRLD